MEEITGELSVLACSNDDCDWSIPDWTQNQIVSPQPVIPELPICQLGHKRAWRLLQKVGHRVDLQCSALFPNGIVCSVKAAVWLAPPGGFLAGKPALEVNQTKARVLSALWRNPAGSTMGEITDATGLKVSQVSGGLDRYRRAMVPSIRREGPYPSPPNGGKAYLYLLTEFGESWVTWAIRDGLIDYENQHDT